MDFTVNIKPVSVLTIEDTFTQQTTGLPKKKPVYLEK